jgi:hypothetical protein
MREFNQSIGINQRQSEAAKSIRPVLEETQGVIADVLAPGIQTTSRVGFGYDYVRETEIGTGQRATEGVLAALPLLGAMTDDAGRFLSRIFRQADTASEFVGTGAGNAPKSFGSFDTLKRNLGPAGEDSVYHHIVEQRAANMERFGAEAIHNTQNVVPVSRAVNQQIANYYSSKTSFSGGQTVRQWLNSKTYSEQSAFGQRILDAASKGGSLPR